MPSKNSHRRSAGAVQEAPLDSPLLGKEAAGHEKGSYMPEEVTPIPAYKSRPVKRSPAKGEETPLGIFCTWVVEHQIGIAANLLLLLALTHASFPRARRHTRKFFELSYYNPATGQYTIGWDDSFFIAYWIVIFTGMRVAMMEYIFHPIAARSGITKKKMRVRFAEQAWTTFYSSSSCSMGLYIMYNSSYWFNLPQMWANWPDREMAFLPKWYYLVQFAFWLQQIIVVNVEERRKDYVQMFVHHLATCSLMFWSYGYHLTNVGNVILTIMDGIDSILSLAKMLKYLDFRVACDIAFGVFIVAWVLLRHGVYLVICYSIVVDIPQQVKLGCYWGSNANMHGPVEPPEGYGYFWEPFRDPEGMICQTPAVLTMFLTMLLFLQVLFLIWLWMIIKVAYKVIRGVGADDVRSEDEDEEEEGEVEDMSAESRDPEARLPVEEEVGVEELNLTGRKANSGRVFKKSSSSSSGVSLAHDHKELLGRIGCDKPA